MRSKTLYQKRLAVYLMFSGKSQKDVAEFFGVAHNTVNEWCKTMDFSMIRSEMLAFIREKFEIDPTSMEPV